MSSSAPIRAAAVFMSLAVVTATAQQPVNTNLGKDAAGNNLRLATKTGHVSNYDESKVKPYTLPDPLVLADGGRVETAGEWTSRRRPELIRTYEAEIFGRIPADAPRVTWTAVPVRGSLPDEASETTLAIGSIGAGDAAPKMQLTVFTPVNVRGEVPVILALQFGGAGTRVPD